MDNLLSNTNPKDLDDFRFSVNSPGSEVINIPVSSEYTANYETFKVEKVKEETLTTVADSREQVSVQLDLPDDSKTLNSDEL
jgi:hypothetical protein